MVTLPEEDVEIIGKELVAKVDSLGYETPRGLYLIRFDIELNTRYSDHSLELRYESHD